LTNVESGVAYEGVGLSPQGWPYTDWEGRLRTPFFFRRTVERA